MTLSDIEIQELRRVLAAFKADLPAHEVGDWDVFVEPNKVIVEDERRSISSIGQVGFGHLKANGRCERCGRFFKGDYGFWIRDEGDYAEATEQAKDRIRKAALRDGPCWGDVPKPPHDDNHVYAVADKAGL